MATSFLRHNIKFNFKIANFIIFNEAMACHQLLCQFKLLTTSGFRFFIKYTLTAFQKQSERMDGNDLDLLILYIKSIGEGFYSKAFQYSISNTKDYC